MNEDKLIRKRIGEDSKENISTAGKSIEKVQKSYIYNNYKSAKGKLIFNKSFLNFINLDLKKKNSKNVTPKNISFENSNNNSISHNSSICFINNNNNNNFTATPQTRESKNEITNINNTVINNTNTCGCEKSNKNIMKHILDMELNLEELIRNVKEDPNKSESFNITRKFSIYKKIFEDVANLFPEYSKIYYKISNGFNGVFNDLMNESRVYKEKSENYEMLTSSKYNF